MPENFSSLKPPIGETLLPKKLVYIIQFKVNAQVWANAVLQLKFTRPSLESIRI